jgi:hypothetical protein
MKHAALALIALAAALAFAKPADAAACATACTGRDVSDRTALQSSAKRLRPGEM